MPPLREADPVVSTVVLPFRQRPPQQLTWEQRFWRRVDTSAGLDDCWQWLGPKDPRGYGQVNVGSTTTTAHRDAYQHLVGPVGDDLELDHLCHTRSTDCPGGLGCSHRACVNPSHLEPVSHAENSRRATHWWRTKPACKKGHPFTEENTRLDARGYRSCRACGRERSAAHRDHRRAAA